MNAARAEADHTALNGGRQPSEYLRAYNHVEYLREASASLSAPVPPHLSWFTTYGP